MAPLICLWGHALIIRGVFCLPDELSRDERLRFEAVASLRSMADMIELGHDLKVESWRELDARASVVTYKITVPDHVLLNWLNN